MPLGPDERQRFDEELDRVMAELPPQVLKLLDEVPLIVDDHPTPSDMARLRVRRRDALCGLYTGIPLTQRSVEHSGTLPDRVAIFREGILRTAAGRQGRIEDSELRRQIRITILHEVGHHFGLTERDLRQLGYD
jgi:predicted Zn-dependent protease with MMP-like domain